MKGIQHSNRKIWDELFSNLISGANSEITIRYGQLKYSYSASYSDECSVCILLLSGWLFRNDCFWIRSRFESVRRSFWPYIQLNEKLNGGYNWQFKIRRNVFWTLYGKRRTGVWPAELSYMTTCCHYRLWRPFSDARKPSHFRVHFLQQFKLGTAFFVRGFGCAFFILNRLRVLFVTALRTIRQFRSTLPLSQQSATASRWIFMRTWQTCRRVQGWYGVWTTADLSLYPPPTAWPAAWNPSPKARRR